MKKTKPTLEEAKKKFSAKIKKANEAKIVKK